MYASDSPPPDSLAKALVNTNTLTEGLRDLGLPYTVARGGPSIPLRSRGSIAALVRAGLRAAHLGSLRRSFGDIPP